MARFFSDNVDLNWWLDAFERHSGEKIKRMETFGYRNQCKDLYLADPEADKKYGFNMLDDSHGYSHRMYLDLDTGGLRGSRLAEAFGVCELYMKDHPGVEVLEVAHDFGGGWRISCREETYDGKSR